MEKSELFATWIYTFGQFFIQVKNKEDFLRIFYLPMEKFLRYNYSSLAPV